MIGAPEIKERDTTENVVITQPDAVTRQEEASINESDNPLVNNDAQMDYSIREEPMVSNRPDQDNRLERVDTSEPKGEITFEEDQSRGYRERTIRNASADVTIALAIDFSSAGERLTKKAVEQQGKKYFSYNIDSLIHKDKKSGNTYYNYMNISNFAEEIVNYLNSTGGRTLNIAGNGIYTMNDKYTQAELDEMLYSLLSNIVRNSRLENPIQSIRSGGQTGIDEAGAKAGLSLGIPTTVLAPKGWKFRDATGRDISDEKAFKARFETPNQTKDSTLFSLSNNQNLEAVNNRFNEELQQQIDGTLPKNHVYRLGMPSEALLSNIDNLPIEMPISVLRIKSSSNYKSNHPFNLKDVTNLPKAISEPVAVFESETDPNRTVVLTELKSKNGDNFIAILGIVKVRGRNANVVNDVISIYPKESSVHIARWFLGAMDKSVGHDILKWSDTKKALS